MDSFLRWAGSKRSLIPQLRGFAPDDSFTRYVEPFAGSAALFFSLRPANALLSDINEYLIAMYRAIRIDVELVLQCFDRLPCGEAAYYRIRSEDVSSASSAERAARFLYLNRYCFNGLFRTNARGDFNVPYGPPTKPLRKFAERVRAGAEALQHATLLALDFESVVERVRPGDLVYLDPPYAVDERRIFREYLPGSFSTADVPRLAGVLEKIDSVGATFLLSYAMSVEGESLSGPWHYKTVTTRRNVAGFSGNRRSATEVVVSNRPLEVADAD